VDINRLTLCAGRCVSSNTVHILGGVCTTLDVGAAMPQPTVFDCVV
jgi:hypothetical protein